MTTALHSQLQGRRRQYVAHALNQANFRFNTGPAVTHAVHPKCCVESTSDLRQIKPKTFTVQHKAHADCQAILLHSLPTTHEQSQHKAHDPAQEWAALVATEHTFVTPFAREHDTDNWQLALTEPTCQVLTPQLPGPIAGLQTSVKPDMSLWSMNKVATGQYSLKHSFL